MSDTNSRPAAPLAAERPVVSLVAHILVGIVAGMVLLYLVSVAANIPGGEGFTVAPVSLIAIAVVGGATVVMGWRWPTVGLVAGLVILLLVAFAVISRIGWISSDWLNPFNAIGFGAASGYPILVGAVLIVLCAMVLTSRPRR